MLIGTRLCRGQLAFKEDVMCERSREGLPISARFWERLIPHSTPFTAPIAPLTHRSGATAH